MTPLSQKTGIAGRNNSLTRNRPATLSRFGDHATIVLQKEHVAAGQEVMSSGDEDQLRKSFEIFAERLSNVSMHFSERVRASIARQIGLLINKENWEAEDSLPNVAAFSTFLRVLNIVGAVRPPSIGSNGFGSVSASWFVGPDRLTLDCLENDKVLFVLSRARPDGSTDRAAGETKALMLVPKLRPYDPDVWFN